jgi:ubiquitin C-terminal hydrolase
MNSGLQCLGNIPELRAYFLEKHYVKEINTKNVLGTKGDMAEAFAKLLKEVWTNDGQPVVPRYIKDVLGNINQQVRRLVNSVVVFRIYAA